MPIGEGFWNVRGSFRTLKVVEIGTQCSLVQLTSGGFVLLDAYLPTGDALHSLLELTDDGRAVEAIVNLHPFHTIHVKGVAARFPNARLYGTERHVARAPDLTWDPVRTEDSALGEVFGDELQFTVPPGVDFVHANESLHFASVLAFHPRSKTLHVDDTLTYVALPLVGGLRFHPTLGKVLQGRPGAVAEFRAWAEGLIERCADIDHLCTAHMRTLPPEDGTPVAERVRRALAKAESVLAAHSAEHDGQ